MRTLLAFLLIIALLAAPTLSADPYHYKVPDNALTVQVGGVTYSVDTLQCGCTILTPRQWSGCYNEYPSLVQQWQLAQRTAAPLIDPDAPKATLVVQEAPAAAPAPAVVALPAVFADGYAAGRPTPAPPDPAAPTWARDRFRDRPAGRVLTAPLRLLRRIVHRRREKAAGPP